MQRAKSTKQGIVSLRQSKRAHPRYRHKKGQATVEFALMGIFLGMLLAGAVDFGRAWYTSIIVANMAAEGAAYASIYPDQDYNPAISGSDSCSILRPVAVEKSIEGRARRVAKDHGMIVSANDQNTATITVSTDGYGTSCQVRCATRTITVKVTYTLNDLFLPAFLGIRNIPISRSASQTIQRDVQVNGSCSSSGS